MQNKLIPILAGLVLALGVTPLGAGVHAPADLADTFDAWGRPEVDAWSAPDRTIAVPDDAIHLVAKDSSSRYVPPKLTYQTYLRMAKERGKV